MSPLVLAFADAGYALAFDGSNDVVKLAETARIMVVDTWTTTKTVEVWVKPEGTAVTCTGASACDTIVADKPEWWGISRGVVNGQDRIWVFNWDGNEDRIGIPYTTGEWVHVALVHNGGVLRAYKNGVEVGNKTSGATRAAKQWGVAGVVRGGGDRDQHSLLHLPGADRRSACLECRPDASGSAGEHVARADGERGGVGRLLPDVGWEWTDADR